MSNYNTEFDKTYKDFCEKLDKFGLCNVVRPTSFGKTTLFMKYAEDHPDKQCLVVEPTNAKINELKERYPLKNVDYITYAKVRLNMYSHLINILEPGMVILFDESHKISQKIIDNWDVFIDKCRSLNIKVGGGSNDEQRGDKINVTYRLFNGFKTYKYDLDDAVKDETLYMPKYYAGYGWLDDKQMQNIKKHTNKKEFGLVQRATKVGHIIKDVIENAGMQDTYYKFIMFYDKIEYIKEHMSELKKEMEQEFKGFNVNVIPITSDTEHKDNDAVMLGLKKRQNTIDLLLAVNKLTEAFHLQELTGAVMLRKTASHIVYGQQLGRVITTNANHKMVLIDVVGNIDVEFGFSSPLSDVLGDRDGHSKSRKAAYETIEVNITTEQKAVGEIINKVNSFKTSLNLRVDKNIIKIYLDENLYIKGENIVDIANAACFGYTYEDVYNILSNSGEMREADKLEHVTNKFIREANGDQILAWRNWYESECERRKAEYNEREQKAV